MLAKINILNAKVREVDQPNQRMVGLAVYTNPNSAAYARKKLHGFEYPPGQSDNSKVDVKC